jgi:hypothetical protein
MLRPSLRSPHCCSRAMWSLACSCETGNDREGPVRRVLNTAAGFLAERDANLDPGMAQNQPQPGTTQVEGEKGHEEIALFGTSNSTAGICNCHRRQADQTAAATSGDFYASAAGILAVAVH